MKETYVQRRLSHLKEVAYKKAAKNASRDARRVGKRIVRELVSRAKDGCFEALTIYPTEVYPDDLTFKQQKTSLEYTSYLLNYCDLDLVVEWLKNHGLDARCESYVTTVGASYVTKREKPGIELYI